MPVTVDGCQTSTFLHLLAEIISTIYMRNKLSRHVSVAYYYYVQLRWCGSEQCSGCERCVTCVTRRCSTSTGCVTTAALSSALIATA